MSLRLPTTVIAICIIAGLAGCGSSYEDSTKSAVDGMRQVIETYNSAHPSDLAGTAEICRTAYDDMAKKSSSLSTSTPTATYQKEARRLRAAYMEARAGFLQCSRAASTRDFPGMVAATDAIEAANASLSAARLAER